MASKFLDTTTKTIAWFKKAQDSHELEMTTPFQRNPVWSKPQKQYLIDSVLNGYPIPEIYMQEFSDASGNERHIIIDGQQRLRACLEFVEDRFELDAEMSPRWPGLKFESLSPDDKKEIFSYKFIVRVLPSMADSEIRGIFQRLNRNVVVLNPQELRHATYWGPFIKTMEEIANFSYWTTSGIFSPTNVRRMIDVEFVSEIAIAVLHGHQNKKDTLEKYYEEYEEEFDQKDDFTEIFRNILLEIEYLLPDIKNTRWKKKSDFYSLFLFLYGEISQLPLSQEIRTEVRRKLDEFEVGINAFVSTGGSEETFSQSVLKYGRSIRASSDLGNRKRRHEALSEVLAPSISKNTSNVSKKIVSTGAGIFEVKDQEEVE